jgi:hypothetical protein
VFFVCIFSCNLCEGVCYISELGSKLHLASRLIPAHAGSAEALVLVSVATKDVGSTPNEGAANVTVSTADSTTLHAAGGNSH